MLLALVRVLVPMFVLIGIQVLLQLLRAAELEFVAIAILLLPQLVQPLVLEYVVIATLPLHLPLQLAVQGFAVTGVLLVLPLNRVLLPARESVVIVVLRAVAQQLLLIRTLLGLALVPDNKRIVYG